MAGPIVVPKMTWQGKLRQEMLDAIAVLLIHAATFKQARWTRAAFSYPTKSLCKECEVVGAKPMLHVGVIHGGGGRGF
jgi:hypothetical protein